MKEIDLLWRGNKKQVLGKMIINEEKVLEMFNLGCTFGLAPTIRVIKKKGKPDEIKLLEVSLIPLKFVSNRGIL